MARALVATGRHRVIYRPHPRTGIVLRETAAAHAEIVKVLREANHADPTAGHVIDLEGGFGWQLGASDVAVMDISAVAYDWLATAKPLLVTRPAEPRAQLPESGLVREIDAARRRGCRRARPRSSTPRCATPTRHTRRSCGATSATRRPARAWSASWRRARGGREREAALAARGRAQGGRGRPGILTTAYHRARGRRGRASRDPAAGASGLAGRSRVENTPPPSARQRRVLHLRRRRPACRSGGGASSSAR